MVKPGRLATLIDEEIEALRGDCAFPMLHNKSEATLYKNTNEHKDMSFALVGPVLPPGSLAPENNVFSLLLKT